MILSQGELYLRYKDSDDFKPNGKVYEAMLLERKGAHNPKKSQRPVFQSNGNLLWPLSVPWSGCFLISANPARDFPRHGIVAAIEVDIVEQYRQKMINASPEIGMLRNDISQVLGTPSDPYRFADGLHTPSKKEYSEMGEEDIEALVRRERLSASYARYGNEVQEIIKFCAKQSVMLAHPSGNEDSALVRDAFADFIDVSG
jgi:hypothetical protein